MPNPDPQSCLICSLEDTEPAARVFRDDLFAAECVPGYEVPGWYFLRAVRHAELITSLDADELRVLGQRARDLVAAVTQATGAPAVYFMTFGETYRHFHALVCARGEDVPKQLRGGLTVQRRPHDCNREAALALVPRVREAYQSITEKGTDR